MAAVVLVALNLRIALSSLPTVATIIQDETGWNDAFIGALTTVPVLCMGLFALAVPRLAHVIGRSGAVSLALVAMALGMGLRLAGAIAITLFLSALLAGISIAIIGGLVPSIVRDQLSGSLGLATSLWTASLMAGAALGAALTLPLAEILGGWNRALAFWALPAVIGLVAWMLVEKGHSDRDRQAPVIHIREFPWRNPVAWSITALTTLNSIVFYSAIAWIAPSYVERGYSPETAGLFFGIFTGIHILGALILPWWAYRTRFRRALFAACIVVTSVAIGFLAFAPTVAPPLVMAVFGFTLSGGFAIPLGMLSEYPTSNEAATRLTAMAFSLTFTIAAFGPLVAGILMDQIGSWTLVFGLLGVVVLLQLSAVPQLRRGRVVD